MATLHMIVGLPCSGKTTYARKLAKDIGALLFTPDVWHTRLFGHDMHEAEHDKRHDTVEAIMWDVTADALSLGVDVILDFGFWGKEERAMFRQRAAALGAGCRLHYMDVSREEIFRRLAIRNAELPEATFMIPSAVMEDYMGLFEPPTPEELR